MRPHALVVVSIAFAVTGCEDRSDRTPAEMAPRTAGVASADRSELAANAVPQGAEQPAAAARPATANRKIIYNAHVDLVTEDLNKLADTLDRLVKGHNAYVADSDRSGSTGTNRQATWKVRVPVEDYDAFLKASIDLGELVSVKADSQDVSEEFYDLEAREKAKKVEEDRLLKHLSDSTGKLDEILTVERELSRVRGEIERMQGRLRSLANLSSLATITIKAREIKGYVPPQAPTLSARVGRTFFGSLETLRSLGETVLLATVALVPWLPLILVGILIGLWANRRITASARKALARTPAGPR